ncbi:MAG: histidine kinase [Bacteroidetes bacterium]|nr:histidine kinase [Bacteroidota bacterium]
MSHKIRLVKFGIQLFLWIILTLFLLYFIYDEKAPFLYQFIATLLVTAFTALPAFVSGKVLLPRLLYRKRFSKFTGSLLLAAVVNTFLTYIVVGLIYNELSGISIFSSLSIIVFLLSFFFVINCIVIAVSSAIQIIIDRFGLEEHLHEVETEKISTELAFLRAQINPHFLFNVMNTIYFQINKENKDARNSVEKLSEMLRYQLYECTSDLIDISKELAYIENYVAVQQLRMEPETDLRINLPQDTGSFKIAPLLILPLLENAFKHISNFKDPKQNKLYITISIENNSVLSVNILNTYSLEDQSGPLKNGSGVGLKNLERRLALLYPGKYSITRRRNDNTYETTLQIQYND